MEVGGGLSKSGLDTVRALHQTVVSLRAALEQSRSEILELRDKAWPLESVENALRALSIENHVLRQNIIDKEEIKESKVEDDVKKKHVTIVAPKKATTGSIQEVEIKIKTENLSPRKISKSLESLTLLSPKKSPSKGKLSVSRTLSFSTTMESSSNVTQKENCGDIDQDQEVDDIELIFTTDDTKDSDFKEQLVSIETGEESSRLRPPSEHSLDVSDRELDDDVFNDVSEDGERSRQPSFDAKSRQFCSSKSDNSINQDERSLRSCDTFRDSSFENRSIEKDESFDRFEERIRIIETDISKVGIQDVEYGGVRRNTCPNPIQYRPILHRETLNKGLNSRKLRPILAHSNAARKDSGAQTDISAIPGSSWRSESSLANKVKVGDNFTTLPSKFPLPGSRLKLSEKTVEARRVLLSDIGFTSMVPELSRSADHLCPGNMRPPTVTTYGQFLRTPDLYSPGFASQKFMWTTTTATPSEGSHSQSRYSSMYPLSSPPAPPRRCSAPVSPSYRVSLKHAPSKVRFANGSLPELRGDWTTTVDSGDSTDSLVDEAESYLRRSIDCIVTGYDAAAYSSGPRKVPRRASAPEPTRDNVPPVGWQPFLPRVPRDLRLDHWVKVISPEGRVRGGRVRYIGPLVSQNEQYVGVQLSTPDGHSDGTYGGRRYFNCEPYHGLFVPFKKIIMGWRP